MLSEDEQELLDGVEEEDDVEGWSPLTKVFLSVLLSFVMLSYVYVFPGIFDTLLGYTQSDPLIESTVVKENTTVVFTDGVKDDLQGIYGEFPEEETALCLYGERRQQTYYVTNYTQPRTYSSSYSHVTHAPCPDTTLIIFHTHPQRRCLPSGADRESLSSMQRRNNESIMLIMCKPARFTIVTSPDRYV